MKKFIIGIDLGGTTTKFGLLDKNGKIYNEWSIDTDVHDNGKHILNNIVNSIESKKINLALVSGIEIGVAGSVHPNNSLVYDCNNLGWTGEVNVKKIISERLNVPTFVENDANVATLGERWQGAGEQSENIMYVTLGTGVGAGLILKNNLYHGSTGASGEIGHMIVKPINGSKCTCGNYGCLETIASASGLIKTVRQQLNLKEYPTSMLLREKLSAKTIFNAAQQNDPISIKAINDFCYYLGLALANSTNMLNLDIIILGGGISNAGEFLRKKVAISMNNFLYSSNKNITKLKIATLGNKAGVLGAAKLAIDSCAV